jgi:hypothetical protein
MRDYLANNGLPMLFVQSFKAWYSLPGVQALKY